MAYQAEFEAAMQLVGQDDQFRKGTWLEEEDERLISFVQLMGDKKWDALAKASGLRRSGKSCRLRWLNYLHPNLKHGRISVEEEKIILQLHQQWGNKWSKIARRLPGRTDNEIKNYWRTHLRKKVLQGDQDNNQTNKDKEDCLFETKNYESSPKKNINYENINTHDQYYYGSSSLEGFLVTSLDNNSSEASAISAEFALTKSPYENRFSDWISEYSNGQSEIMMNYQNESSLSVEYSSSSGYCDYYSHDSWDCSGFLWDMN